MEKIINVGSNATNTNYIRFADRRKISLNVISLKYIFI